MIDNEKKQKIISVGETNILDASEYSPKKRFYALTADVFDQTGKVNKQMLLKDIVSSEQEVSEFIERSKKRIVNIQSIQLTNGGHLENIYLFNLSVDEAEQKGLLRKPEILQHTQ